MIKIVNSRYHVFLHRPEVTHVEMDHKIIVPVGEVFSVIDKMHISAVSFLLEGWTEKSVFRHPEGSAAWLDTHNAPRWWVSSTLHQTSDGKSVSLWAGNNSPFLVLEREFR